MAPICRARLLSDLSGQTACGKEATSAGGRLCAFHSRQCQALYRGYKKRNAELDTQKPPAYLTSKKVSIAVLDFNDIEEEAALRQVHDYIFRRYNLLDRVIRARKLHHSHFYAIDNDYGHEKYLDRLQNERYVMVKGLEKLGKRAAALMHQQKQWYDWVKKAQEEEEKHGETESKKVKLESLLFRRHQKEIARHQREAKSKEDQKREEEFLNQVYTQRLCEMSEEEQDEWDPIQDVYGFEKDNYIDLIKFFLMLEEREQSGDDETVPELAEADGAAASTSVGKVLSKSAKKRARKANAEVKKLDDPFLQTAEGRGPNVIEMETKQQMRDRLRKPIKFERPMGWYFQGNGPAGSNATTAVLPDDEIEQLLDEVAEIKNFLFCRLLLSQATLLPIALETDSINDFLNHSEVTREHLRDLCLKLERPGLQDVRDACADFIRERDGADEEDAKAASDDEDDDEGQIPRKHRLVPRHRDELPEKYQTKREKAAKKAKKKDPELFDSEDGVLDFGKVTDESNYSRKRMRIKVCGRYMYNYPSEKALNRGGWFHFSIIAKDSDLFDAVELARNWNEFFELNILCLYHYFPAPKWTRFVGDLPRQQLLQLGFIPYFNGDKADKVTHYFQTGSRGMARRSHEVMEMRNFICGHIKRDDPVSRRFIQYLSNETWEIRALDRTRKWRFGFDEYYDVYVWDATPGRSYFILQRKLEEILTRALRVHDVKDMFSATRHILQTITRDPETERVRSIKPGEEVTNMWDSLDKTAKAFSWSPGDGSELDEGFDPSYAYTEADELEDALLFPLEASGEMADNLFRNDRSAMEIFEKESIDVRKFAADLDTDDEPTDSEAEFDDDSDLDEEYDSEDLDGLEDDDEDPDWESEEDSSDEFGDGEFITAEEQDAIDKSVTILSNRMKRARGFEPDYFLPIIRDPSSARDVPDLVKNNPTNLMHALRNALRCLQEYDDSDMGMERDFIRHVDRQKSKVFKNSWHQADQEPGAMGRYAEMMFMISSMDAFLMGNGLNAGPFELCKFMQMASHFREERRVVDDAFKAYAAIALFFESKAFLDHGIGKLFTDSQLLDQEERAKHVPDRRTHLSNKTMPDEFWKDWDKLLKDNDRSSGDPVEDIYPLELRKAIRPIVIRMFRAGVICSSYGGVASGIVTAKAEPNRPMDLYIDYRVGIPAAHITSHLKDPTPLDRDFIIKKCKSFLEYNTSAKFAVMRIWSAPHFYPLMLGMEKRPMCAFLDDRGRCWEFKFIPKDMPYSEWSVHQQLSLRLEPYKKIFGQQVIVAKDLVLVMGRDEKNLRQLAEGVTWAVQTKPWRLEIDFWRSFVNVDVKFLEELDRRWLD
ncbi:hypothetical protein FB567DRAFT_256347 [Paraphoma chrysanthemicola]|uniref:Uncharacterized protein n=1 Tax=Paraphoma chrysanthemicola TaxID=798071 RepID=A0A8K0QSH7_9PLEO|nr:hypothetical protein FB567DRAFT_256347 [Paraphoma chrysanthemicola]